MARNTDPVAEMNRKLDLAIKRYDRAMKVNAGGRRHMSIADKGVIGAARAIRRLFYRFRREMIPLWGTLALAFWWWAPYGWLVLAGTAVAIEAFPIRFAPKRLRPPFRKSWVAGETALPAVWSGLGPVLQWPWWWHLIALAVWAALYVPYLRWSRGKKAEVWVGRLLETLPMMQAEFPPLRGSQMTGHGTRPGQEWVTLDLRFGGLWTEVRQVVGPMAAALRAPRGSVSVHPVDDHDGTVRIVLTEKTQMAKPTLWTGPTLAADGTFDLVRQQDGSMYRAALWTPSGARHFFFVAGTGGGKSTAARLPVIEGGLSDDVAVIAVDCKGGRSVPTVLHDKLSAFVPFFGDVGSVEEVKDEVRRRIELVERIDALITYRMKRHQKVNWSVRRDGPILLVHFEEFGFFFDGITDKKQAARLGKRLAGMTKRARSLGIGLSFSLQNPRAGAMARDANIGMEIRDQVRANGTVWIGKLGGSQAVRYALQGLDPALADLIPPVPGGTLILGPEDLQVPGRTVFLPSEDEDDGLPDGTTKLEDIGGWIRFPSRLDKEEFRIIDSMEILGTATIVDPAWPAEGDEFTDTDSGALALTEPRTAEDDERRKIDQAAEAIQVELLSGPLRHVELRDRLVVNRTGGLSRSTFRRALRELQDTGTVRKDGTARTDPYILAASQE